jgi:hypothetical protein
MFKKKYSLHKQIIIKQGYKENYTENLLKKSLQQNHNLKPLDRLSYFCQDVENLSIWHYFSTYQHLQCLVSLSLKVNDKKFNYSRFFLNKQLNKLTISNTLK